MSLNVSVSRSGNVFKHMYYKNYICGRIETFYYVKQLSLEDFFTKMLYAIKAFVNFNTALCFSKYILSLVKYFYMFVYLTVFSKCATRNARHKETSNSASSICKLFKPVD